MLSLDPVTRAEYDALSSAQERGALVVAALSGAVTVTVYDDAEAVRGSGAMSAPWARADGVEITAGALASFIVTNGGVPSEGWSLRFESGGRWLAGSFGLLGSGADFTWSLPTFETGQAGAIGEVLMTAHGLAPVEGSATFSWSVLGSVIRSLSTLWSIATTAGPQPLKVEGVPAIITISQGGTYDLSQHVSGGVPPYFYVVESGTLPAGVALGYEDGILSAAQNATIDTALVKFKVFFDEGVIEEPEEPEEPVDPPPPLGDIPSWLAAVPMLTWHTIPGTALRPTLATDPYLGPNIGNTLDRVDAWCGAALKHSGSELFWMGGGHADGASNAVYSIKLNTESPGWVMRRGPSTPVAVDVSHYADGRPSARHTYWSIQFNQSRNLLMLPSANAVYGSGGANFNSFDAFDPVTNDWLPAGTFPDATLRGTERPMCMDADDNIYHQTGAGANPLVWWDNDDGPHGTWKSYGTRGDVFATDHPMVWDSKRNRLVHFQTGSAWVMDLNNNAAFSTHPYTGPNAGLIVRRATAFYCPVRDSYLHTRYGRRADGLPIIVTEINPETWEATELEVAGTAPTLSSGGDGDLYGRFTYAPELQSLVLMRQERDDIVIVRLGNSEPPSPPPPPASTFKTITLLSSDANVPVPAAEQRMEVLLHGSGTGAPTFGDVWQPTADSAIPDAPWRFAARSLSPGSSSGIRLQPWDRLRRENGTSIETYWMGCVFNGEMHLFTEAMLDRMMLWYDETYPLSSKTKRTIGGNSMGAWGSTSYAIRRPHMFAAIFASRPRLRYGGSTVGSVILPHYDSLSRKYAVESAPKIAGTDSSAADHLNIVAHVANPANEIPFYAWVMGRNDGYSPFIDHIDMVAALRATNRGFAFAWNDGDHGTAPGLAGNIEYSYKRSLFEIGKGYPIFSNSSLDKDPAVDLAGGINLGFTWRNLTETASGWSCEVSNELGEVSVTVRPYSKVFTKSVSPTQVVIPAGTWVPVSFS